MQKYECKYDEISGYTVPSDKGSFYLISEVDEQIASLLKKLERSNNAWTRERAENEALKKRLEPIFDVWGRWKDFQRTSYQTVEQVHQALYDFEKAIKKSMTGYNPERIRQGDPETATRGRGVG